MNFKGENIWIIGASSGIGRSLCFELAHQGARVILSARREEELIQIKKELTQKSDSNHLTHHHYVLDVADANQVSQVAQLIKKELKVIHRVIFMAAIYEPKAINEIDLDFAKKLIEVNLMGAIYCTQSVLTIFNQQKFGQLSLCASSAGFLGLPNGQPYSASKAALINFSESLASEVKKPIDIKLINPGFVETPMTEKNQFAMPMKISSEKAAKIIAKGLKQKRFEIHFPKGFTYLLKFTALFPYPIQLMLTQKLKKYEG